MSSTTARHATRAANVSCSPSAPRPVERQTVRARHAAAAASAVVTSFVTRPSNKYKNLYYACRGCNKVGAKGEQWPSPALRRAGYRFFDPVKENAYVLHMRETASGLLRERNKVGDYSIKKLRLNREGLVLLRKKRQQMRQLLHKELHTLLASAQRIQQQGQQPPPATLARLQQLRNLLNTGPVLALLPDWW